jgi:hypothetical protein
MHCASGWPVWAPADAVIGAVPCPVLLKTQQAQQSAGTIDYCEPTSPVSRQCRGRGIERVRRTSGAAVERAEFPSERGTRYSSGQVGPLDRRDQAPVGGDDQRHVDVVVFEKHPDFFQAGSWPCVLGNLTMTSATRFISHSCRE